MALERRPTHPRPRGIIPLHSTPHPVADGESWTTLSQRYGVSREEIIYANFGTLVPEEVNWYLRHHVGCTRETDDGKNLMFSSGLRPGVIYIPPQKFSFPPVTIEGALPPRYFTVREDPGQWTPPEMADDGATARIVVTRAPWTHQSLTIGGLSIRTRKAWGAKDPEWKNEVIYYNTFRAPLTETLRTIIIHHTDNDDAIAAVEAKQKSKGYAALGYHFFVDQQGVVFEGRPLEVMGSNAGEGEKSGPTNDPDWGAIGIVVQGDYHHADDWFSSSTATKKQLQGLETLVVALKREYPIERLLMHREIKRKGETTVCPGDAMVPHVEELRKKLGIPGP